jgi:RNA polymerase sigma factor (TIGR02999 family)
VTAVPDTPARPGSEADDAAAARQLAPLLYGDLRRVAHRLRRAHRPNDSLQTTALIHEAYLKMAHTPLWQNRAHFLRAAAMAMRQVLIDAARSRLTLRRGEGAVPLPMEALDDLPAPVEDEQLLALEEALGELAELNPRLARVVECRYFAGYSELETAEALGVNERTVRRDWVKARAWLYRAISADH